MRSRWILFLTFGALAACGSSSAIDSSSGQMPEDGSTLDAGKFDKPYADRDWSSYPAVVDTWAAGDLYAISDLHAGFDRAVHLLHKHKLIANQPELAADVEWSGGDATLVVTGDLIDKGSRSLETMDLIRKLQHDAPKSGGQVIALIGNHEAEFLADPFNSKAAEGINLELDYLGIDPKDVAKGKEAHGVWMRNLPFAARIGAWFFCHAGDTHGDTLKELDKKLRDAISTKGWSDKDITGDHSILESQEWFKSDPDVGWQYADALGALHIVFGHDPKALGPAGLIAVDSDGVLFRIDTGMSPAVDYGEGEILRIRSDGKTDTADALDASGGVTTLWTGSAGR